MLISLVTRKGHSIMAEISAKIVTKRIISSNICISKGLSKNLNFNAKSKATLKTFNGGNKKNVLLNIELNICTAEEELKADFVSDIIFELEQLPNDYNELVQKKLVPMAQEELIGSMNDMLVIMGYPKLNLKKRI